MARARNIKPGFFQNDDLGELDPIARLLFIGMWTICDFKGCLEFRPKRIKAQILPYDNCCIEELTNNLDKSGFVSIYSVLGQRYIKIINFERHQNPHKNEREAGSDIPDIDKKDIEIKEIEKIEINPDKDGSDRADSLILIPEPLIPIPSAKKRADDYSDDFEKAWAAYPDRPGANKKATFKQWNARLKAGCDAGAMISGAEKYAAYVKAKNSEPEYIKQPATFFGPAEHFKSDWTLRTQPPRHAKNDRSGAAAAVFGVQQDFGALDGGEIIDVN